MKRPKATNHQAAALIAVSTCVIGAISAVAYKNSGSEPVVSEAAGVRAGFDFYLMAMSIHAAWCADGNTGKTECRAGSDRPLVVHGLWPERREPRTYPRDCAGPRLDLEPATEEALRAFMPGMQSGLHVHEWREHGTCSGLDDDAYFRSTLDLARGLDAALRDVLTTYADREIDGAALRAAADRVRSGIGRTFTLHCRTLRDAPAGRRGQPFLVEIRQCVDDDGAGGAPGTPLDCATVNRRDQGCGGSFGIANPGPSMKARR